MKKKIAILISGNIRIFEQNKNFINKILSKFECFYFAAIWKNQKNSANLKLLYHPIQIQEINRNNWDALVKKIKYVTYSGASLKGEIIALKIKDRALE